MASNARFTPLSSQPVDSPRPATTIRIALSKAGPCRPLLERVRTK